MSAPFTLVRTGILATTNICALTILGLSVYTFTQTASTYGFYFIYSALGIATGIIHLGSMTAMAIVGRLRNGAYTSRVSFQVGWLAYLSIMWLATGAQTAATMRLLLCRDKNSFCGITQAIEALAFFNWITLFGYVISLVMAAVKAGQTGKTNIWLTDVKDLQWIPGPIRMNFVPPNLSTITNPLISNPNPGAPSNPNYNAPSDPSYGVPSEPNYGVPSEPNYGVPSNTNYGVFADANYGAPSAPESQSNYDQDGEETV